LKLEKQDADSTPKLSDRDFRKIQEYVYEHTGIHLPESKRLLVLSRLSKRVRNLGYNSFGDYLEHLFKQGIQSSENTYFINKITTNKTDFYREEHHFEFLRNSVFPIYKKSGKRNIRIWSAGCSTGQEAYTLAMEVLSFFSETHWEDIKILATDIDTSVLQVAKEGTYPAKVLDPVSRDKLMRYTDRNSDGTYTMKPLLKNLITFKQLNFKREKFPFKYGFDIVFCRNVIIYFKKEDRPVLIRKLYDILRDNGHLFLGHSESLLNERHGLVPVYNTVYRKK